MGLLDLFCGSSIFSLLLIIIVIGVMYSYYNYKLTQQDYKIRSLFSVVKQLAEEQNAIKVMQFGRSEDPINLEYATQLLPTNYEMQYDDYGSNNEDSELISVSEDGDEDDDASIGEEEEIYEDDGDDDIQEDDDNQEDDDSKYVDDSHSYEEIKTIHLEEPIDLSEPMELNFSSIVETTQETDAVNDNNNLETTDLTIDDIVDPSKINILEDIVSDSNVNVNVNDNMNVNINNNGKVEFKKMSLGKLREVVVEKGLVVDASKLKKNELLKLLGDE